MSGAALKTALDSDTEKTEEEISKTVTGLAGLKLKSEENSTSKILKDIKEFSEKTPTKEQKIYEKRSVFCCTDTVFYKPRRTDNEDLFEAFLKFDRNGEVPKSISDKQRGLQVVRQKNFGPIEEKRYFSLPDFKEMSEENFQKEGYKRLNSFKNLKCSIHNLFFEINAYRKGSAVSFHHTSTVDGSRYERDSSQIDLTLGTDKGWR